MGSVITRALDHGRSLAYGVANRLGKSVLALILATGLAQAEPVRVAALGDSLTQGYGLLSEQGFVPQMQGWLTAHGAEVTLINAGVSGDTTAGGRNRVGWTLTPDVDGMIVTLGGNDLLRGIDPAASRENLRDILVQAQAAEVNVFLVGMRATGNFGPEYKADFDSIYPDLAAEFQVPLFADFFAGLRATGASQADIQSLMQADGIHPNPEGVVLIVDAMGPALLDWINRLD